MRTLSAELTAAQRASAYKPYIDIELISHDGATTLNYKTDDATNRILRVRTDEKLWGGELFQVPAVNSLAISISGQIVLSNHDEHFTSKDLRGYKVLVKWGFTSYWDGSSQVSISGTKTSTAAPMWVFSQREVSQQGNSVTELWLIDAWQRLEFGQLQVLTGP